MLRGGRGHGPSSPRGKALRLTHPVGLRLDQEGMRKQQNAGTQPSDLKECVYSHNGHIVSAPPGSKSGKKLRLTGTSIKILFPEELRIAVPLQGLCAYFLGCKSTEEPFRDLLDTWATMMAMTQRRWRVYADSC
eukprot:gene14765-4377_t